MDLKQYQDILMNSRFKVSTTCHKNNLYINITMALILALMVILHFLISAFNLRL